MSPSEVDAYFQSEMTEHAAVAAATRAALAEPFARLVALALDSIRGGGKILFFGNGGSAADAQHLAAELVCRVRDHRGALPAVALTTDTSALTAIANDYGFARVFARQVEALARPDDLLVAVSTSGNSDNVIEAALQARAVGCTVVAMTGRGGGRLAEHADLLVAAPAGTVSRIQEVHVLCVHVVAQALEDAAREGMER